MMIYAANDFMTLVWTDLFTVLTYESTTVFLALNDTKALKTKKLKIINKRVILIPVVSSCHSDVTIKHIYLYVTR